MKYYCKNCESIFVAGKLEMVCAWCGRRIYTTIPDYETPEQWEKRTGGALSDDTAVWYQISNIDDSDVWGLGQYLPIKREAERIEATKGMYHTFTIL
ncbi:MAG: hypothetical protein LBH42_08715, partial [Treponema sp.]|nr:hypothetical protein [Treponema sp.]